MQKKRAKDSLEHNLNMEEIARQDSHVCEELQRYVDEGKSYALLMQKYPSICRARSVRRFCSSNNISKKKDLN